MNPFNPPLNNPHSFCLELRNHRTYETAYTILFCTSDTPTEKDIGPIADHLVTAAEIKANSLNWDTSELSYNIVHQSPSPSSMPITITLAIYEKVCQSLKPKEQSQCP